MCTLLERFERRSVALISVAESLDTGSAAGRLVLNIMTAVSQWEREAIGERTRDALGHKRSKGERVGNIPFGLRLAGDGEHLEPDPTEQAALAEIRRLRTRRHRHAQDRRHAEPAGLPDAPWHALAPRVRGPSPQGRSRR